MTKAIKKKLSTIKKKTTSPRLLPNHRKQKDRGTLTGKQKKTKDLDHSGGKESGFVGGASGSNCCYSGRYGSEGGVRGKAREEKQ